MRGMQNAAIETTSRAVRQGANAHLRRCFVAAFSGPMKLALPQLEKEREGLGRPTIMDRALAARHGVPYVHLAAFAIDVDRIRDASETDDDDRPFAWEVFVTARYLAWRFDPKAEEQRALLEDTVQSVLELPANEEGFLGSQFPFAVWVLVAQGLWPKEFELWFKTWKKKPRDMVKELAPIFANGDEQERALAKMCLDIELSPPIAPPTKESLRAMARVAEATETSGTIDTK